jgi:hypothetical protein
MLNGVWHDTRFALRMLRRQRRITTIAVLTLAVGIGANIAIITVGDAVLLRPLPYPDADRLVALRYSPVSSPRTADSRRYWTWPSGRRAPLRSRQLLAIACELSI